MHLRFSIVAAALALPLLPAEAAAESTPPGSARERADALFVAGKDAIARGELDVACARFRESLGIDRATGTLLNLGDCELRRGDAPAAYRAFTEARGRLLATDYRTAYADEKLAAVTAAVARLSSGPLPHGAHVRIDGADVTREVLEASSPVEPGHHEVVIEAPGRASTRVLVDLGAGEKRQIALNLTVQLAPDPPPPAGVAARRPVAYALLGLGVAGVAAGAVFGIMTVRAADDYEASCSGGLCTADGLAAAKAGRFYEVASPVAFAGGAALGAVGLYLVLTDRHRVQVAPTGTGAVVRGAF